MARARRHEPTQPRNPRQLTIDQHVHSKACIKRFADQEGLVHVVRAGTRKSFPTTPDNPVFCAKRVWDQHLEQGLFRHVEQVFQNEVRSVLGRGDRGRSPCGHRLRLDLAIRGSLADTPPEDIVLRDLKNGPRDLTKQQEEIIESKHGAFTRGSSLPARFAAFMDATRGHDFNMLRLDGVRWGVLRTVGCRGFLCPGAPAGQLYIPWHRRRP